MRKITDVLTRKKSEADLAPSQEELNALLQDMPLFSLKGVRQTLQHKSRLFRTSWFLLLLLTTLYLMGWFSGILKPYMSAAVTGESADYQIHQIRFLIGFGMLIAGTVAINFNWQIERVFAVIAWVQAYFIFSGVIRQWRTLPDDRLIVIGSYAANLLIILALLIIMILEERRLNRAALLSID
jgi:hypothetical protein